METKTRRGTRQMLAQWFEEKGGQAIRQKVSQEFIRRSLDKRMSREDVAEVTVLSLAGIDKLINSS